MSLGENYRQSNWIGITFQGKGGMLGNYRVPSGIEQPDYQPYQENVLGRRPEGQEDREPSGRIRRPRGGKADMEI